MITALEYLDLHRPEWMGHPGRHCRGVDTSVFFNGTASAIGICEGCPVQKECRDWALDNKERGVWGGTTERGRKRILRARRKAMNSDHQA